MLRVVVALLCVSAHSASVVRLGSRGASVARWPGACAFVRMSDADSGKGTPLGDRVEKLSVGERISKGTKNRWINPAYWNRQFVTASHIANNVPNGSNVLELGKDATNLSAPLSDSVAKKILPLKRHHPFLPAAALSVWCMRRVHAATT